MPVGTHAAKPIIPFSVAYRRHRIMFNTVKIQAMYEKNAAFDPRRISWIRDEIERSRF